MSDHDTTRDLMTRLRRHYIKPGPMPGGIFIDECGLNGVQERRCDALYVGFTSASGRMLVGHEVKASRADWLSELNHPGKADRWADQCHQWWLVTAPGVVQEGELPDGWGHMVPGPSKTRMRVVTKARTYRDREPSWLIVRSIMARLDTLQLQQIAGIERDAERVAREKLAKRQAERAKLEIPREMRVRIEALEALEKSLGCSLTDWEHPKSVTAESLTRALRLLTVTDNLTDRYNSLSHLADELARHADRVRELGEVASEAAS